MNDFYATTVHNRINAENDATRERYRRRIDRELAWMGWQPERLIGKRILDVGTGWQALRFIELGAGEVVHRDLSPAQVDWLSRETVRLGIGNLHSRPADLCGDWGVEGRFDLIFLLGVYHHLANPAAMLDEAMNRLEPNGALFLRLYRSGTWSRWLMAHLRRVATSLTPALMEKAYSIQFPLENDHGFLGNMLDDLFTPVWGAFHPDAFERSAPLLGGTIRTEEDRFAWDFSDRDENFRVLFTRSPDGPDVSTNTRAIPLPCVLPVDQFTLPLDTPQARRVARKLEEAVAFLLDLHDDLERACRLLTLCRLIRRFDAFSYYAPPGDGPMNIAASPNPEIATPTNGNSESPDLGSCRLQSLETILQRWGSGVSR
ncbi:MAG: class I SAM-dependent methyltransferase [Magnetococcales bacterium]|nr:class I SAM-dependent methyltransferase [Magnetococcales bacterium]